MTVEERRRLIDALLDGDISEADFLRLESELAIDPGVRREYYDRVTLSLLLEAEAAELPVQAVRERLSPTDGKRVGRRWRRAFAAMVLVSAALLLVVVEQWNGQTEVLPDNVGQRRMVRNEDDATEAVATGFAVVSGQAGAVWAGGRSLGAGSLVPEGELHLKDGIVELELFSGVTLVVEGEARFAILSPMEVVAKFGKIRASVPEPARGFRMKTVSGEVVDLGTEFAVNVTDDGEEVHVLSGKVEWHPHGSTMRRMELGEAIRRTSIEDVDFTARPADFVGPVELRERLLARQASRRDRWLIRGRERRQDPRLTAYYLTGADDVSRRRLRNLATGHDAAEGASSIAGEGAVVAAVPDSDRWGQASRALDFSPSGSRVRLFVPGEHRSLTLVCWVKINSLDRWYNSLFLTDGHEEGEPHWQIMDDGRLFFSVKKRDRFDRSKGERDKHVFYSPPFWSSELSGQWLMIATVYDVDAGAVTHFLNGEVLSRERVPDEYLVEIVRIGHASIGNWGLPERDEPRFAVRNLNGSLDEFALFSAALTAEEIGKLYDDGKP